MEFVATLKPFGIAELVQTGTVSMTRGSEGRASLSARNGNPETTAA